MTNMVPGVRLKAYHWSVGQGSIATYCIAASQSAALEQIAGTEAQPTLTLTALFDLNHRN